eukprot:CAMPEP_0206546192 /NCGR_PEP_ID=MMETSP0325_2-20121206/12564_1 /ASSEMBLY_ACC=CAM_ASM_000347 /TAXON_ID=2866 /ORGANISM="Crypthecodinium cohnii, Strain Seligo" /LENGTH=149 /DNA_ID=CAMNT_0054045279 /DNA_START=481 /DNA_END=931 /DNA_ORIENTATION=+
MVLSAWKALCPWDSVRGAPRENGTVRDVFGSAAEQSVVAPVPARQEVKSAAGVAALGQLWSVNVSGTFCLHDSPTLRKQRQYFLSQVRGLGDYCHPSTPIWSQEHRHLQLVVKIDIGLLGRSLLKLHLLEPSDEAVNVLIGSGATGPRL